MLGVGLSALSGKSFGQQSSTANFKVLESKTGKDTAQMTFQITDANGEAQLVKSYVRRIDHGDSYTVISHISNSKLGPAKTTIVMGTKGTVEGEYRLDRISSETIFQDGTMIPTAEQQRKVLVNDPYQGLNPQEKVDRFMQDKAQGKWSD